MSDKTDTKASILNPFAKLADAQLSQINAFYDEVAKLQATNLEHAKTALDESARLSKETLGYWAALGAESRRMTLDAYKRGFGFFGTAS